MEARELDEELPPSERPTIPPPCARESGVRLRVAQVPYGFVRVDVVVCDLSRDPRSEMYVPRCAPRAELRAARYGGLSLVRCRA